MNTTTNKKPEPVLTQLQGEMLGEQVAEWAAEFRPKLADLKRRMNTPAPIGTELRLLCDDAVRDLKTRLAVVDIDVEDVKLVPVAYSHENGAFDHMSLAARLTFEHRHIDIAVDDCDMRVVPR